METSHVIIWVSDTAIVKKPLMKSHFILLEMRWWKSDRNKTLSFLMRVEYLQKKVSTQRYNVITKQFAEFMMRRADYFRADGCLQMVAGYRKHRRGRFSYPDFRVWYNKIYDQPIR